MEPDVIAPPGQEVADVQVRKTSRAYKRRLPLYLQQWLNKKL